VYSYLRLLLASWLFMGGVAIQFLPSAASVERDTRERERQFAALAPDQRAQALRDRDIEDARSQAFLRLFGVLLGGLGFAMALHETAYVCAQYIRGSPPGSASNSDGLSEPEA
jgi:hypothetical protein